MDIDPVLDRMMSHAHSRRSLPFAQVGADFAEVIHSEINGDHGQGGGAAYDQHPTGPLYNASL
jgi:hypothetical protein